MFIKPYWNCMPLDRNTSMTLSPDLRSIVHSLSFCDHCSDAHLTNYLEEEFLDEQVCENEWTGRTQLIHRCSFRWNRSRNMLITSPIYDVWDLAWVNISSTRKNSKIKSSCDEELKMDGSHFFSVLLHAYIWSTCNLLSTHHSRLLIRFRCSSFFLLYRLQIISSHRNRKKIKAQ